MQLTRRSLGCALAIAIGGLGLAPGGGWTQHFGSRSLEEHYLRVDWQLGQTRRGAPIVWGHVHNVYGELIGSVKLSIQELDGAGNAASTTVGYVDGVIQPKSSAYFETRVPRPGQYRVAVLSYTILPRAGG